VDDILITRNNIESIKALKQFHARFRIKNLGDLKFFLGIEIAHSKRKALTFPIANMLWKLSKTVDTWVLSRLNFLWKNADFQIKENCSKILVHTSV